MIPFFQTHPILDTVAVYLALAFVGTMPAKDVKWSGETLYDWIYDFAHVAINFIPPSRRPQTDPQQPAGPAQPAKE